MIWSCKRVISLGKLINQVLGNNFLQNYNPHTMERTNEDLQNQSMSEIQGSLHNEVQRVGYLVGTCIKTHSLDWVGNTTFVHIKCFVGHTNHQNKPNASSFIKCKKENVFLLTQRMTSIGDCKPIKTQRNFSGSSNTFYSNLS